MESKKPGNSLQPRQAVMPGRSNNRYQSIGTGDWGLAPENQETDKIQKNVGDWKEAGARGLWDNGQEEERASALAGLRDQVT